MILADVRIGLGYDRHRLEEGRKLVIGGVDIPHNKGLRGHSDGDLLCHVIMDALLGAADLGEIGLLFPDTNPEYKDADSLKLLEDVGGRLKSNGCKVINIDCVIIAQEPKLSSYYDEMKRKVSSALEILPRQVRLKAKTGENLGWVGGGEGMEAFCTALVEVSGG